MAQGESDPATALFPVVRTLHKYSKQIGKNLNLNSKALRVRCKLNILQLKTKLALALKNKE